MCATVHLLDAFPFMCYRLSEVKEGSKSKRFAVLHRMSSGQPSATPQFAQLQVTSKYAYEYLLFVSLLAK